MNIQPFSLEQCIEAATETKELLLKQGALAEVPGLVKRRFNGTALCLIADEHTFAAAGKALAAALDGLPTAGTYIFPGEPRLHADYGHVQTLIAWIRSCQKSGSWSGPVIPAAVGSGTVNDLVKRAAFELGLPYICVPTAASVDGYTANGAALLVDGFKQTLPCTAPLALAADTGVLSKAPRYLSSSGFGDLASKIVAGTDWIIADKAGALGAPGAEPIDSTAWAMTQPGLKDSLARSVHAAQGDGDAVNALFSALAVTGFAMQYFQSSRPVSGAEHLFSHIWEMEDLSVSGVPVTHGYKVALGTLASTAFTEIFFADPKGPPEPEPGYKRPGPKEREAQVRAAFAGTRVLGEAVRVSLEKLMDKTTASATGEGFRADWKNIRDKVLERLMPYGELKALLAKAGCPVVPETINLTRPGVIATAARAQMMRNKYCVLDLAWDLGVFDRVLSRMEESEAYLR